MNKYLLLRDNKQSGPYTCDELQQKGLKAYDLVWAEGKSAAWRYPSEIDELKSFAPVVEEQPFDRFYKKTSSSNVASQAVTSSRAVVSTDNNNNNNILTEPAAAGKRIIYVTLPAGKPATAVVGKETTPVASAVRPVSVQAPVNKNQAYLEDGQLSSLPGIAAEPAEDNLTHRYEASNNVVEINPRTRERRSGRALQLVMVAASILLLLAAGVFIGISIDRNKLGLEKKEVVPPVTPRQTAVVTQPVQAPVTTSTPSADTMQQSRHDVEDRQAASGPVKMDAGSKSVTAMRMKEKTPQVRTQPAAVSNTASKDSAVATYAVAHREASHRTDMAVEKMDKDLIRNNLTNLVSIGASHYTVGTFGGISDLQLTVSNRSVYPLDLVVVEVQYIQANKKVYKTENLYFRSIGAGSALMQEAPKSTRGVKVQYKITLVNSKELGLSYSAL